MNPENTVHPSNPLSSRSRAVVTLHAANNHFPDGERDKIRLLDNERAMGSDLERDFPVLRETTRPVLARPWTAREAVVKEWVAGDRAVKGNDGTVETFRKSVASGSVLGKTPRGVRSLLGPPLTKLEDGYEICTKTRDVTEINFKGKEIDKIPRCMSKYTNLKTLYLYETQVNKIENLDKNVNLQKLDLGYTPVSKIENLDKNVNLEWLFLNDTRVSKIDNLDKNMKLRWLFLKRTSVSKIENLNKLVNLKGLNLSGTSVSKIENLDTNVNLERLDLDRTRVSKIENLDTLVNLKVLYLGYTRVSKNACGAFKKSRPGISVSC